MRDLRTFGDLKQEELGAHAQTPRGRSWSCISVPASNMPQVPRRHRNTGLSAILLDFRDHLCYLDHARNRGSPDVELFAEPRDFTVCKASDSRERRKRSCVPFKSFGTAEHRSDRIAEPRIKFLIHSVDSRRLRHMKSVAVAGVSPIRPTQLFVGGIRRLPESSLDAVCGARHQVLARVRTILGR